MKSMHNVVELVIALIIFQVGKRRRFCEQHEISIRNKYYNQYNKT